MPGNAQNTTEDMQTGKLSTKDIVLIGAFAAILLIQKELLAFIPNVSLTVFLIVLYSKAFGMKKTLFILLVYVLLDNIIMGNMGLIFVPFQYIGWALIPLLLCTVFKRVNDPLRLALLSALFSFLYCWIMVIPGVIVMHVSAGAYLAADITFELILAASSFVSVLLLYKPCYRVLSALNTGTAARTRRS